jgi:hypothetical protein
MTVPMPAWVMTALACGNTWSCGADRTTTHVVGAVEGGGIQRGSDGDQGPLGHRGNGVDAAPQHPLLAHVGGAHADHHQRAPVLRRPRRVPWLGPGRLLQHRSDVTELCGVPVGGQVERLGVQAQEPGRPVEVLEDVPERLQPQGQAGVVQRAQALVEQAQEDRGEDAVPGPAEGGAGGEEPEAGRRLARLGHRVVAVDEQGRGQVGGLTGHGRAGQDPVHGEGMRLEPLHLGHGVLGVGPRGPEHDAVAEGGEDAGRGLGVEVADQIVFACAVLAVRGGGERAVGRAGGEHVPAHAGLGEHAHLVAPSHQLAGQPELRGDVAAALPHDEQVPPWLHLIPPVSGGSAARPWRGLSRPGRARGRGAAASRYRRRWPR